MISIFARRGPVLYGLLAATIFAFAFFTHQIRSTTAHDLDPHPAVAPWQYFSKEKPPNRFPFIPGKGGRCKKTIRIVLDGSFGLGSSLILLMIPGLTLARHHGYTPLIDDSGFNYGRLTDYLEPMQLDCDPGEDWQTMERTPYYSEDWQKADHLLMHRGTIENGAFNVMGDNFWRETYMLRGQSKAVWGIDNKVLENAFSTMPYLPSEMSFSQAVRPAYRAAYRTVNEFFTLNRVLRDELEKLVKQTRPHRREGVPVLGAIIRLGDKAGESGWNPGANAYANWNGYAESVREQRDLLTYGGRNHSKPILVLMSDDVPMAMDGMKGALEKDEFDIRPIDVPVAVMPFAESDDRYEPPALPADRRRDGHNQWAHNSKPNLEKVASARTFVRDLYYMAKHTDSLVVSSTSNVGRVALMLAGEEKAYGSLQSDANAFKSIGGLSRSIDTRWFPCVYYVGCFKDAPPS